MWSVLALGAFEKLFNRIIDLDAISRIKLNQLQGQMLRVVIDTPNLSVDIYFDQDKLRFEPTAMGQANQVSIFEQRPFDVQHAHQIATTTLHNKDVVELLKLLNSSDSEIGNIPLQGDYHLLFNLKAIMANLELDLAAQLSPWIGPTLAHEIGKIQNLPKQLIKTTKNAQSMLGEGLKEDIGLFAGHWQIEDLQQGTRKLLQDIERIEAKFEVLHRQLDNQSKI